MMARLCAGVFLLLVSFSEAATAEASIWGLALVANGPAKFALLTANASNGHFTLVGNGTAHSELAVGDQASHSGLH